MTTSPDHADEDYILIVGADVVLRERTLAGALRAAAGRPVFSVGSDRSSPGLRYFDGSLLANIADGEGIVAAAREHESRTGAKPFAVVPTNDFTVTSAAQVAAEFGLPHNSLETVERCRDKALMKEAFARAGVPTPQHRGFTSYDELKQAVADLRFPVVIKPRQMAGSLGVIKVDDPERLEEVYRESAAAVESLGGMANSPEDLFQVEEYIDYPYEVSVEVAHIPGVGRQVLAVTDKLTGAEPYFVEVGHIVPSRHSANEALADIALRACEALGIEYGVAHFEAKVSEEGDVRVIEVAARTGGDAIMDLVEDVYGINPYQVHVQSYLPGEQQSPARREPEVVAGIGFLKAQPGVVAQVRPADLLKSPEVKFFSITARKGDLVKPLTSWRDREGFVRYRWPIDGAGADAPAERLLSTTRAIADATFVVVGE
ncbi:MAG: ATP-grasp domain-containing protein [Segniliparus sp.]|uniref:ATP-grasp domain-containing protein n=1 Tax=Segniliparus sp. TaxID=2804064 RepID=UPI003F2FF1FB